MSFHSPSDISVVYHFPYRPAVCPSSEAEPRSKADQKDRSENDTRVIHVLGADGLIGRKDTEDNDHDRKHDTESIDQDSIWIGYLEWAQRKVLLAVFPYQQQGYRQEVG